MIKNLLELRKKINQNIPTENKNINHLLKFLKKNQKKLNSKSKIINLYKVRDWHQKKNGDFYHKSGQFFSITGVRTSSKGREVRSWDQPILRQKHGGVLAILVRETKKRGIEFLISSRFEPGDDKIKFCPSFQATQSNINLAHGGKKTLLSDLVIKKKGTKLIAKTIHYEEGARFWRKPNTNLILYLKNPNNPATKKDTFVWANFSQIKKLNFKKGVLNPFVKTILFMI